MPHLTHRGASSFAALLRRFRTARLPVFAGLVSAAWCSTGCVDFNEYPEGDLCVEAARDELGRATTFPEWRICPIAPIPTSADAPPPPSAAGATGAPLITTVDAGESAP